MKKINARDCIIKEVSYKDEKRFLEENHRQGYARSLVCYGLYLNEELVQLMSLGRPRFNKNYQWELIRDCTKDNYLVRGGVSKLWRHFLKKYSCRSCICYSYPHESKETNKYIDNCGFKRLKNSTNATKIKFVGVWNGENKSISKSILERHGVDRLLKGSFGQEKTNEQILLDLGFKKEEYEGIDPQIDIYYPFSIVYRIDDLTSGEFYIGMTENKAFWESGYLGSGGRWSNHVNAHQDHEFKRSIIKENLSTPKETRDLELKTIKKYFELQSDGSYRKINDKCCNTQVRTQGDEYIRSSCPECGAIIGHKTGCSRAKVCPECGSYHGRHKKICSKYKQRKECPECGGLGSHKKTCSKYTKNLAICGECGAKHGNHKKFCSKYMKCPECGGPIFSHKNTCSHYIGKYVCSECGGKHHQHKKTCSKYVPKKKSYCPECGGTNNHHKKNCSLFKNVAPCSECGGVGKHRKHCSRYKELEPCQFCGSKTIHKKGCPNGSEKKRCPECGYTLLSHQHSKSCSRYKERKGCPECGSKTIHKKWCSKHKNNKANKD